VWGARAGEVYGAWKRRGRRVAAGELRLLLPGRHSEVRGDLWMPLPLTLTLYRLLV
jgi:hypothetical protein